MKTLTIALVVPLLILAWATGREAQAAPPSASPTLVLAEAPAGDASFPAGGIDPMPDGAVTGAWCLGGATAAMAAVYAAGPSESAMLLTGAMHVASGSAVLFIPLLSILGGGSCALAAAAQPAVSWAIEQKDNIAASVASSAGSWFVATPGTVTYYASAGADDATKDTAVPAVRAMAENEIQATGCLAGALAGFGGALATSPSEVAMLSSGATTVVSSTPILALGLLGTIVVSGCGIGTYAILPIQALFSTIGAAGGSLFGEAAHRLFAWLGGEPAVRMAERESVQ